MGKPVKDYWNWIKVTIPQTPDWRSRVEVENYLDYNFPNEHKIFVTTEYPKPRKRYSMKVITEYHYYLKDPKLASWLMLKLG